MGKRDDGHFALINDLQTILAMADKYDFHDFKNEKFATSKIELKSMLDTMSANVENGIYDN